MDSFGFFTDLLLSASSICFSLASRAAILAVVLNFKKNINKFTHKVTTPTNYRYNGTSDNRQREERITPKKDKFPSTHCDENHTTPSHFGIKLGLELSLVSVTVSSKWAVVLDPKIISHWVLGNFKIVQMTF